MLIIKPSGIVIIYNLKPNIFLIFFLINIDAKNAILLPLDFFY